MLGVTDVFQGILEQEGYKIENKYIQQEQSWEVSIRKKDIIRVFKGQYEEETLVEALWWALGQEKERKGGAWQKIAGLLNISVDYLNHTVCP